MKIMTKKMWKAKTSVERTFSLIIEMLRLSFSNGATGKRLETIYVPNHSHHLNCSSLLRCMHDLTSTDDA